jgi:general secretion pathway protein K
MMPIPPIRDQQVPRRARRPSDGFIIVAVLWILMMLAGLAAIYSAYLANTAVAVEVNDDGVQVEALASAGVELAAYQLTALQKRTRPSHGQFDIRLGHANVTVAYLSESARIDLNMAGKPVLAGLFTALGAQSQDADRFADRILGWRTTPTPNSSEIEDGLYQAAGLPYVPRGAPFAHVDELWLVQGLPPALVERALPFVTVYSGRADVNVLVAAPQVLAALPDMTPDRLDGILNRRDTLSFTPESAADVVGSNQPGATTEAGDAFRIHVRIALHNGRRAISEAVILLGGDHDEMPYHVLSWRGNVAWSQMAGGVQ